MIVLDLSITKALPDDRLNFTRLKGYETLWEKKIIMATLGIYRTPRMHQKSTSSESLYKEIVLQRLAY